MSLIWKKGNDDPNDFSQDRKAGTIDKLMRQKLVLVCSSKLMMHLTLYEVQWYQWMVIQITARIKKATLEKFEDMLVILNVKHTLDVV